MPNLLYLVTSHQNMSSPKHQTPYIDSSQLYQTPQAHKYNHEIPKATGQNSLIVDQQTPTFKCSSFTEPTIKTKHKSQNVKLASDVQHLVQLKTQQPQPEDNLHHHYYGHHDEEGYQLWGGDNKNTLNINLVDYRRFCYRVWGKHHILKNVTDFNKLFAQIKQQSNIQGISLDLSNKIPHKYKGAIINIYDQDDHKLKHALTLLLNNFTQIQQLIIPNQYQQQHQSLTIIIPQMLVPVMMGKQGRLISKIKNITNSNVTVRGPYAQYCYQNVQISGGSWQNVIDCCYLLYKTVYRVVRDYPVSVPYNMGLGSNHDSYVKIGINVPYHVSNLLKNDIQQFNNKKVFVQIDNNHNNWSHDQHNIKWIIDGTLSQVKQVLNQFVSQIYEYEDETKDIQLLMTANEAKYLTSYYGKFLRDISIKSQNCYLEIIAKQGSQSRFIITGSPQGKKIAVFLVVQFLFFASAILSEQKLVKSVNYEEQLDSLAQSQLPCSQSQWKVKKHKKKRKTKNIHKEHKNNNKHSLYHLHEGKDNQRFKSTMIEEVDINF